MKIGSNEQSWPPLRSAQLPPSDSLSPGKTSPALTRDTLVLGTKPQNAPASLDAAQEKQYQNVKAFLLGSDSKSDSKNDAVYLDKLLNKGLLTSKTLDGQTTLIQLLDSICTQPLAKGLDRIKLIHGLVHELSDPTWINQAYQNTCAPAAAQITLAIKHPAECARLVSSLAYPDGQSRLFNGATIYREAGTAEDDKSRRTPSSRLLQAAFMEYANGDDEYDNKTDQSEGGGVKHTGLTIEQEINLLNALDKEQFEQYYGISFHLTDAMDKIAAQASSSNPITVNIKLPKGLHCVDVTDISKDKDTGKDMVTYISWGKVEKMERDEFQGILSDVALQKDT